MVSAERVRAAPAPFDLSGPTLRVTVTRQGAVLPIAAVPQLAAGDRLSIAAALPADEAAHYLLVAGFLRDPTNPPPDKWFQKSQTWQRSGHGGGPITVVVPAGAQHLVLFLAPATGGDFGTLRAAVQARPGAFVRAAQDLEQASLDRSRYEAYLTAIRKAAIDTPDALARVAPVVAASLHIKINDDCLQRQPEFQAACLLDAKQAVVLGNDDTSSSTTLSSAAADLALSLSETPAGGLGYYSPYILAVREIVGIFSAMHTARYQYIPALDVPSGDAMALVLNTPPSFANPKSVLMAALPAVAAAHPPVLAPTSGAPMPCLGAKEPVLPVAISPLFYATAYAHDLALRVDLPGKTRLDLPLTADASRGGLVIGLPAAMPAGIGGNLAATVVGQWGFEPFSGPQITLQTAGDWHWQLKPAEKDAGDKDAGDKDAGPLVLTGATAACVASVTVTPSHGSAQPASWKSTDAHDIAITLPALAASPGEKHEPVTLTIVGPQGTTPAQLSIVVPAKPPPPSAQIVAHSSDLPHAAPGAAAGLADKGGRVAIILDSPDEIPADAPLSFTLKASGAQGFSGRESVEISTADGDAIARLTLGNGLVRVDAGVMVASLIPALGLGQSAFGPLRARLVRGGVAGEWLNLGTLVRLPRLKQLSCPANPVAPCTLTGDGLYLLASVSATRDFDRAVSVAEGYPGFTLAVPHPATRDGLFVRLHDAPEVVNHMGLVDVPAGAR